MTTPEILFGVAFGVPVLLGGVAAVALVVAVARDKAAGPATPDWTGPDLAAFSLPACPVCGGQHCAGCEAPARITATWTNYRPRHDFADLPPSIVVPLALMSPGERARELVRQLGQATWHPYGGLPRWARARLVAATVAARHGLPLLVGTFAPVGRLP